MGRRGMAPVLAGTAATLLLGLAAPHATADPTPAPAPVVPDHARVAAHDAAMSPRTLDTLARFFARDGALTKAAATPRIEGERAVPVSYLSRDFVAGKKDAPIAELAFLASEAVAADGQKASLWTVERQGAWKVVNIASGDDETRYAALGAHKLPGGTVFQEPQIDAWYVADHARVLPLDADAVRAVGRAGISVTAYRARVDRAYGDKLPGSAYAKKGEAGGYGTPQQEPAPQQQTQQQTQQPTQQPTQQQTQGPVQEPARGPLTAASALAGTGALAALLLSGRALRRSRRARGTG
ncbi:hypothetical protein [Streptomyces sp. VRA16 Mangrove soil]|uniref:hypothetical protein n=1 Tax=Streptomyces sp. VRA16 Mangrove soil TaxID=2817434 RepID=UPI001A9E5AAB|nr:hypothetical protein [Streptomyces sp. VRA16 Mangrove soil]